MKVSCRKMWAAFFPLKLMWVMGVSRSAHRWCTPCFSSARLHGVYSFCTSEYSKICNTQQRQHQLLRRCRPPACVLYLLVGVHRHQVATGGVDGDGGGAGPMRGEGAVKLWTRRTQRTRRQGELLLCVWFTCVST